MTSETANVISVFPSYERAVIARKSFYFTVVSSLAYLKNLCADQFEEAKFSIEPLFIQPNRANDLNPEIFYINWLLLTEMRKGDSERIIDILAQLKLLVAKTEVQNVHLNINTLGKSSWEAFITENAIDTIAADMKKRAVLEPVDENETELQRKNLHTALQLIESKFSDMHAEITTLLNQVKIFQGSTTMGVTDVRMFGCMFIRVPREGVHPALYYAEHIVHEVSHMYLNAAMTIDPLILNDRQEKYLSPLRPDPRPMMGVFHATFVTSRIVQLFWAIAKAQNDETVLTYLSQQLDEFAVGIDVITESAKLTPAGKALHSEFKFLIDQITHDKFIWEGFDREKQREHRFGGGILFVANASLEAASRAATAGSPN